MTFTAGSRLLAEDLVTTLDLLLDPPRAQLRQTSGQTIATSTFTAVTFGAEDYDTDGGHDNVTNNSRYTAQTAGVYRVSGKVSWSANATGQRASQIYLNGSAINGSQSAWPAVAAVERQYTTVELDVTMAVNDYVQVFAFQDSGGNLNTGVANAQVQSILVVRWVGTG